MTQGGYFADTVEEEVDDDPDAFEDVDFDTSEIVLKAGSGASVAMQEYFRALEMLAREAYDIAEACRRKGFDPELAVEIPRAEDLAARVEELVGPKGVAPRIRELSRTNNRELVSLLVAKEVAAGKFGAVESKEKSLDAAIRTGLAILTEGILVAPLEGIAGVRVVPNDDGTTGVAVSFAGPIRAAGGTGQALSVLIADVVRRELGFDRYKPTQAEIDRFKEEIPAYKIAQHLQYTPSAAEIDLIVRGCPIMIDGEGTEDVEVGGNRDLPRVETNRLRGGACLVVAEGLTLKAPKVQKHVKNLKLEGWEFIDAFLAKGSKDAKDAGATKDAQGRTPIEPNPKYLLELTAGRPIFAYPLRKGGFRLRYGRSRTGGLASTSLHPATMRLLDDFLAVGTQMKVERPGKGTVATPCDTIEGPVVLLHNGSLREVRSVEEVLELRPKVRRIVDLGEILVPFGEFAENNKILPQSSYAPEWWAQEVVRAGPASAALALVVPAARAALRRLAAWRADPQAGRPPPAVAFVAAFEDPHAALGFAAATGTPVHPQFNLFWHDASLERLADLSRLVETHGSWRDGRLVLPKKVVDEEETKEALVELGALHEVVGDELVFGRHGYALLRGLGLDLAPAAGAAPASAALVRARDPSGAPGEDGVAYASRLAGVTFRPRAPWRIGTRMGRPEKAAERKMSPPVHVLFPLGQAGGVQRLVKEAAAAAKASKDGVIEVEVGVRQCTSCKRRTVSTRCDREGCGGHTRPVPQPPGAQQKPDPQRIPIAEMLDRAQRALEVDRLPETIKGVQGLVSKAKTPEVLEKGILRAKHEVFTFKDGTIRFDMTDVPVTHFKPREVGAPVARLRALGYAHDVDGAPLERDDQTLELRVQDVIVSTSCVDYLLKATRFVDEELTKLYGVKPYYNAKTREDLVGQLVVGLAPHTSGGVLARIVGHTVAQVGFAHPYFHAAKRRNCVRGDTEIVLVDAAAEAGAPGRVVRRAIGPWVEKLMAEHVEAARFVDAHGTEKLDVAALGVRLEAITLDPVTRAPKRVPVTTVLRGRTEAWVRIRTAGGRKFVCTPDHNLLVSEEGSWVVKPAEKAEVGDLVPIATTLPPEVASFRPPGPRPTTRANEWHGFDVVERVDWVESEGPTYCLDVETGSRDLATKNVLWGNGLYQIRCDGDEDCVMLLLDGLLNFSRAYLPQSRGGQMDAPLTLTLRIDPSEVDKEAHNVDCAWMYPLEFFEATTRHPQPKEVEPFLDSVAKRLGKPGQYEGLGFTHDTRDLAEGPAASAYKTIGDMMAKMEAQLDLAAKIRAVDAPDVAARVIGSHFLPDLRGNLVAFSKQKVRCTKCNAKYRRIPLRGTCAKCGANLTLTVHEGSVKKYLEVSKQICEKYGVNQYTRQRIEHIEDSIDSIFSNDRVKKAKLSDFF